MVAAVRYFAGSSRIVCMFSCIIDASTAVNVVRLISDFLDGEWNEKTSKRGARPNCSRAQLERRGG
jgi:hypothetical protein